MDRLNLHRWIGLSGVATDESPIAQKTGKIFEFLLLFLVLTLALQWYFELENQLSAFASQSINFAVWAFFVLETGLLTLLCHNRLYYLKTNWMNIVIIIVGIFMLIYYSPLHALLRFLRPLLFIILLLPWLNTFIKWLRDTSLLTTLIVVLITIILFGVIITAIEPNIHNPIDGIWWALVTVSTVGYGDFVPMTTLGRIIAGVLIVLGLGFFAVITANFSALFMERNIQEDLRLMRDSNEMITNVISNLQTVKEEEEHILDDLNKIKLEEGEIVERLKGVREEENYIESLLIDIQKRLDNLESKLDKK